MILSAKIKNRALLLIIALIMTLPVFAKDAVNFELFNSNDEYFIEDIDINNDGLRDKVVSSKEYEGDELLFFLKKGETYVFSFKGTNFSVDGGEIIKSIQKESGNSEVMSILTYFSGSGGSTTKYFIAFMDNDWVLTRTIYEVNNWQNGVISHCDIKQNLKLSEFSDGGAGWDKLKRLPKEKDRRKLCATKSINKTSITNKKTYLYKSPNKKTKMYLIKGDKVTLLDEQTDDTGQKWYFINYKGKKDLNMWIKAEAVNMEAPQQVEPTKPKKPEPAPQTKVEIPKPAVAKTEPESSTPKEAEVVIAKEEATKTKSGSSSFPLLVSLLGLLAWRANA